MPSLNLLEKILLGISAKSPNLSRLEKFYLLWEADHNDYWREKFTRHHPCIIAGQYDSNKLRLLLGIGRSGTTWLGKMLATTSSPIRYFEEPLYHLKPQLYFGKQDDHSALSCWPSQKHRDRLIFAYKLLTLPQYDWHYLGIKDFLKRNDDSFKFCLVKEVHSLLASEQVIAHLQCPTVIIIRNPLYIVDSIINAESFDSGYLESEAALIRQDKGFLSKICPEKQQIIRTAYDRIQKNKNDRHRILLGKILTVAILTASFKFIAQKFETVTLVSYEDLCANPEANFAMLANFFGFQWGKDNIEQLRKTMRLNETSDDPYSIHRLTHNQIKREMKVFSEEERKIAEGMLEECGLVYGH